MRYICFFLLVLVLYPYGVRAVIINADFDGWKLGMDLPPQIKDGVNHRKNSGLKHEKEERNSSGSIAILYPWSSNSLLGLNLSYMGEEYEGNDNTRFKFEVASLNLSYFKYLPKIENGIYLRAEIGVTASHAFTNNAQLKSSFPAEQGEWHFGHNWLGGLVGIGYNYKFTKFFGMDIHAKYHIAGTSYGTVKWSDAGLGFNFTF